MGKKSIDDLVRRAVSADRDKLAISAGVAIPRQVRTLAWASGVDHIQFDSSRPQTFQRLGNQLATASSARSRIHHGEKSARATHSSTTAARPRILRTSSASWLRLIFMDAVRGKS